MAPESSISHMFFRPRLSAKAALLALASFAGASSCLFKASDRCDPGQVYNAAAGLCMCDEAENMIAGEHACIACGANATAKDDVCTCDDGFTGDGMTCNEKPKALGVECQVDSDCKDSTYSTCHLLNADSGYCTNTGCAVSNGETCTGGYACDASAPPGYCERPPSGAGMACDSDKACANTDATYCETFKQHQCFVQGCSLTENDCFPGKECCDLAPLSAGIVKAHICVDSGKCGK
ncbi:MAG: hypothetical protein ABJB12_03735 [Pseudomonadota bacterium]